jgi:hypothetical protein
MGDSPIIRANPVYSIFFLIILFLAGCSSEPTPSQVEAATVLVSTVPATQDWWRPRPNLTWQWQLSDPPVDMSFDVDVYDIDLMDIDASVVADLHSRGDKVICYISVGSWEDWRPDKDQFPPEVLGKDYEGWPGEKWLDIKRIDLLAPIMRSRLDLCKAKGFDAVEPDNMQIYDNDTGFPITYEDQLRFSKWLADEAHSRGLAIGMKNAPDQVEDLLPYFDFAITEDCFAEGWCEDMLPFIQSGKPVFAAEYDDTGVDFYAVCSKASEMGFSVILKRRSLDASRTICP